MQFKSPTLVSELRRAHPKAIALALYTDWFAQKVYDHEMLVTDVDRTQDEYDTIYAKQIAAGQFFKDAAGRKHYAGPRPHLWNEETKEGSRAVDFRTSSLVPAIVVAIRDHLNANFPRKDGKPTAIFHDVGAGAHLHVQAEV